MFTSCTVYTSPAPLVPRGEARQSKRHAVHLEATSHAVDASESIAWGAVVRDLSAHGVGLVMCYPFRSGTPLVVELKRRDDTPLTVRAAVVHVRDQTDGSWLLGCAFDTPLAQDELDDLIAV